MARLPSPQAHSAQTLRFKPHNVGRWAVWGGYALLLAVAPLLFTSGLAHSLLTQMGIAIIVCLSYNLLLGQGGMLSFGHALYSGMGAFLAIHVLNAVSAGAFSLPVSLLPLVGGLAGLGVALVFGYLSTRRAGTTFAMITLGLAELVAAMALMVPGFFGGESGVSGNRVVGQPFFGISFGPQVQVYYLVALYCLVSTALMFALTRTPLGRMLNAVRDNAERVEFIGYSAQHVRYLAFIASGFFAGIGGGLAALNTEIVNAEVVGAARSGAYLLFTFLGGATVFFGPIIGGVLMVVASALLSEWTPAWLLYLGLAFIVMVMYAPGGIASLIAINLRVAGRGKLRALWPGYVALCGCASAALCGASAVIEMVYHLQFNQAFGPTLRFMGASLRTNSLDSWFGAAFVFLAGAGLFELTRRQFVRQWDDVQHEIEAESPRRGSA